MALRRTNKKIVPTYTEPEDEGEILPSLPDEDYSTLPLDPGKLLESVGVVRNRRGDLVHYVPKREGIKIKNGKRYWEVVDHERPVAPPGMSLDEAREKNLDVYTPRLGWVWGGYKRASEHPDNLGYGIDAKTHVRLIAVDDDEVETLDGSESETVDEVLDS